MKKLGFVFTVLMALALVLAACSGGQDTDNDAVLNNDAAIVTPALEGNVDGTGSDSELPNTGPDDSALVVTPSVDEALDGADMTAETPAVTEAPSDGADATATEAPMATEAPQTTVEPTTPMTTTDTMTDTDTVRGAQILPNETAQQDLIRLSNWMGFEVVDQNGQNIGQVQDYIINTCEAHVLYMVVQPADGSEFLIPYEAVSVNNGSLNAETNTITINIDAAQLADAPVVAQRPDLSTTDWEGDVRNFWSGVVDLSNLDTSCSVAPVSDNADAESVNVYKIAYASNLLSANLQDANQNALGQVQDALVQPQSGQLFYLVVSRQEDGSAVLVPMRGVNIPESGVTQDGQLNLVLLVDNSVLTDAPAVDALETLDDYTNADANNYWNQYVPMNPGQ